MAINNTECEGRLSKVEERTKSNTHRIDDMEKRQDSLDELVGSVKVLACREENVENVVKEIKTDVKILTGKSGKRWESIVDKSIFVIIGIVIAYVFSQIGM